MRAKKPAIDVQRLRSLLDGINAFGRNPETGGFNRIGYSKPDMEVRRWFAGLMEADGLNVTTDAVANVFGRFGPADGPSIMAGSHLDTVPEGGAFDGALGVAVALECVRAIRDAGLAPGTAIEVVATAEEEGRFGGMLGSQAITGQVSRTWLESATDPGGLALVEAMRRRGLDPGAVSDAARPPGAVAAFLELHIEQGPVLEAAAVPVGIANRVSGVSHLVVRLAGRANHSGTTPMDMRADAFAGLAEVAGAIPGLIADEGTEQTRITIGKVDLEPNFPHTIAGVAEFTVIVRDTEAAVMERLGDRVRERIADAARGHGLTCSVREKSALAPVALDAGLVGLLQEEARKSGLATMTLPSGAGHDAQTMQALCSSALLFVPSRGGVSHAPDEWTDWADIERGADLMLAALVRLSGAA